MEHIIKNNPCSLETWIEADEVLPNETDLHFSRKDEVKEYLNRKL